MFLNVKDRDGKVENWAVETGAPLQLVRRGGDKKSLAIGTELIVDGRIENLGSASRSIVGTWMQGNQKGDFKITRQ